MKRLLMCMVLSLTLTACAIGSLGGPDFTTGPTMGMTKDEVRARWGVPYDTSWYGDSDTWTYRRAYTVVGPYTSTPTAEYYTVHFYKGKVSGASW